MTDRVLTIPIDFDFSTSGAPLERSFAPEKNCYWGVIGIWLSSDPWLHVVEHMGPKDQTIALGEVDASSYNAAPRIDGLPRHVSLDAPLVTSDEPFVLRVKPGRFGFGPSCGGHLVVSSIRSLLDRKKCNAQLRCP